MDLDVNYWKNLLLNAVGNAQKEGAVYADARFVATQSFSAGVSKSRKNADRSRSQGVAVRALVNGVWGYSSTNTLSKTIVLKSAGKAVKAAKAGKNNKEVELAQTKPFVGDFVVESKKDCFAQSDEDLLKIAEEQYNRAKSHKKIADAKSGIGCSRQMLVLATSDGGLASRKVDRTRFMTVVVSRDGKKQRQYVGGEGQLGGLEVLKKFDWSKITDTTCKRSVELLDSVKTPIGEMPVVFAGGGGGSGLIAHEAVGHAVEGDYAMMDRSYFNGKIGTVVGNENLNLVENGLKNSGFGAIGFDDEGTIARKAFLIKNGVFETFMLDRQSAAFFDLEPTGNARAQDHTRRVYVRMRNTYIENGDWNFDEMIEETKKGVLCNHWKAGIEDPAGGSFQLFFLDGNIIENGEIGKPLYNISTSQNATLDALKNVSAIGNDLKMDAGGCGKGHADYVTVGSGGPSLRIDNIIVGGA
ncbi:MAG: TldD/PmbA family protein [Candidatus Micrarchaeia archaeon]